MGLAAPSTGGGTCHSEVTLVSADRKVWSGEASRVIARTVDGDIGILGGHEPLLALLDSGDIRIDARPPVRTSWRRSTAGSCRSSMTASRWSSDSASLASGSPAR